MQIALCLLLVWADLGFQSRDAWKKSERQGVWDNEEPHMGWQIYVSLIMKSGIKLIEFSSLHASAAI